MGIHLRTTGVACHMGSHNVTCHPTQANTPRLNPSPQPVKAGTRTVRTTRRISECVR